jgi:hypothetical protein
MCGNANSTLHKSNSFYGSRGFSIEGPAHPAKGACRASRVPHSPFFGTE